MFKRTDSNGCPVSIPASHVSWRSFIKHVQRGIQHVVRGEYLYKSELQTVCPSWYPAPYTTPNNLHKYCGVLLLLLLLTAIEFSLGGSSSYTSTDKTNKNKYT